MPLIDGMTAFNKEADGEGHFEVHTQLNKIKILFNSEERLPRENPFSDGFGGSRRWMTYG